MNTNVRSLVILHFLCVTIVSCSSGTQTNSNSVDTDSITSLHMNPSHLPGNGQTGISTAAAIEVHPNANTGFDVSSFDKGFYLTGPTLVQGSYAYDPEYWGITFIPDQQLMPYTQYTAVISTDLTSSDGIHPKSEYWWSFTTGRSIIPVSISSEGVLGNYRNGAPDISDDGSVVAFWAESDNLVDGDTNNFDDIFIRDIEAGETKLVSIDTGGGQFGRDSNYSSISGDGNFVAFKAIRFYLHNVSTGVTSQIDVNDPLASGITTYPVIDDLPAINYDGRYVAFQSASGLLTVDDKTESRDVFIRDTLSETTHLVSVSSSEEQANHHSYSPTISSDGRYVAFYSYASNLVDNDTNGVGDIFLRDTVNETTIRVSLATGGIEVNDHSTNPILSSDGRYIAFSSLASNLVTNDNNAEQDVFLHDVITGNTHRISVDSDGVESDGISYLTDISGDGRYILFSSKATNLGGSPISSINDVNVYLHDTFTSETIPLAQSYSGGGLNSDGKYWVFHTTDELSAGDAYDSFDVFRARLYPEVN